MSSPDAPPDIKIDCTPITLSNDGESVPVYTVDKEYSNSSAQVDFMKTVVIFGSVLFIIVVIYSSVPFLYKNIIVENILIQGADKIGSIKFIGGLDIFVTITLLIVTFYNFIIGASSIGDNAPTRGTDGILLSGNAKEELDGYNKIIFAFISGFFFIFSGFLIYTRKKKLLNITTDTGEIAAYAGSLSMENFKLVLSSYLGILWKVSDLPFSIIFAALLIYYVILVILITARGTDSPEWVKQKFQGNDIITQQTFYDCCFFYPFVLLLPTFAGIGYIIKQMQLAKVA
jgi:hypothetical protein